VQSFFSRKLGVSSQFEGGTFAYPEIKRILAPFIRIHEIYGRIGQTSQHICGFDKHEALAALCVVVTLVVARYLTRTVFDLIYAPPIGFLERHGVPAARIVPVGLMSGYALANKAVCKE
jgi:hypothetical protein